jgi:hypothetical protein
VGLLKVDIEGAELDMLTSFDDWDRVDAIVLEWHGDLLAASVEDARSLLRGFDLSVLPRGSTPGRHLLTGTKTTAAPDRPLGGQLPSNGLRRSLAGAHTDPDAPGTMPPN